MSLSYRALHDVDQPRIVFQSELLIDFDLIDVMVGNEPIEVGGVSISVSDN